VPLLEKIELKKGHVAAGLADVFSRVFLTLSLGSYTLKLQHRLSEILKSQCPSTCTMYTHYLQPS